MKVVGLVTEYNPFHNGHKYHIEKAREITNADYVIAIMSGDYVQRGAPAIFPKHLRTHMALSEGADLVLELPHLFATSSAETFAYGSIKILDSLGVVDNLVYGCEDNNQEAFNKIAMLLNNEPVEFKNNLTNLLKDGLSYPTARKIALENYLASSQYTRILSKPNNILGIEYTKALFKLNSTIMPVPITRICNDYHDKDLATSMSSATSIRSIYENNKNTEVLSDQIPSNAYHILKNELNSIGPINFDDFSQILYYKLSLQTKESLSSFLDCNEDLANRILYMLPGYTTINNFIHQLKTKELTYTRISRALLHILLDDKVNDMNVEYTRILGFRKESSNLIREIKNKTDLYLITKTADYNNELFKKDIFVSHLYQRIIYDKYNFILPNEYERGPIIFL